MIGPPTIITSTVSSSSGVTWSAKDTSSSWSTRSGCAARKAVTIGASSSPALMTLAGHDTVNSAISGTMHGLLTHPEQFAKVQAAPALVAGLVDEGLRWATPAKHFMRNASRDTVFAGHPMQRMDRVMCLFVSGNRDEEVFAQPFAFDVTHKPNPHLSLSFGPHLCLGQHVARMEMRALYAELIPRLAHIEPVGAPQLKISNFVSGQKTLPMRFRAA